jgi:uncharacterized membrane protein
MSSQSRRIYVIILSLLGLFVSLFIALVIEKEENFPGCTITGTVFNCADVVTSQYGYFFNIPVSIIGAFWFITMAALYFVEYYDDYVMAVLSLTGISSIVYFIYIELIVLETFCLYCTIVHIIVIIMFLLIGPESIKNSYEKLKEKR